MAQKSLNQAFIKAYSKGRNAKQNQATGTEDANAQYLLRVDTATVEVPAPHMLRPAKEREAAVAKVEVATSETRQPIAAEPRVVERERSHVRDEPATDLRDSIASQMMQAGAWEEGPIDAFIGGFPMIAGASASAPTKEPSKPPNPEVTPPPAVSPAVAAPTESLRIEKPIAATHADPAQVSGNLLASSSSDSAVEREAIVNQTQTSIVPEQGDAKQDALSSNDVERIVADYMQRHGKEGGGIFRLDRPTYADAEDEATDFDGEPEFSNESDEPDQTLAEVASQAAAKTKQEQVAQVEEELRNVQDAPFNPVWEVDQLQWPEVCLRLIERRAESLEKVASNLVNACQEGLQVLAVTSPQEGEGRTTVACCLAKLAGSHGLRVAIVDADTENPTLSLQTNLEIESDWRIAITEELPLEEIAVHSLDDHVTLIPLLDPIDDQDLAFESDRIGGMLQQLAESFDLVVVDMSHMDSHHSLVTSLSEQGIVNAVVAVVDYRVSDPQQVESCLTRIKRSGVSSVGLVENFVS